jgi:hypothetical protein
MSPTSLIKLLGAGLNCLSIDGSSVRWAALIYSRGAPDVSPALKFVSVAYSDLDDDGIAEGAITLNYATRGTMNCEYLYLFKIKKGRLRFLGCLRSGSRAYEGFNRTSIENGLLILDFADAEKRRRLFQWIHSRASPIA